VVLPLLFKTMSKNPPVVPTAWEDSSEPPGVKDVMVILALGKDRPVIVGVGRKGEGEGGGGGVVVQETVLVDETSNPVPAESIRNKVTVSTVELLSIMVPIPFVISKGPVPVAEPVENKVTTPVKELSRLLKSFSARTVTAIGSPTWASEGWTIINLVAVTDGAAVTVIEGEDPIPASVPESFIRDLVVKL
jgi:hypothetical protein